MRKRRSLAIWGSIVLVTILVAALLMTGCAKPAPTPGPAPAPGEVITWRYNGNFIPEGIPGRGQEYFAGLVKERSGGRLIIEPYFAASLGFKPTEGLSVLKKGLVDMNEISAAAMGEEPIAALSQLPFMFSGVEDSTYWALEKYFPAAQQVFDQKGWNCQIVAPVLWPSATMFFSKKPLRNVDDFKGVKVRCWGGILGDALKIIGTEPFVIATAELYTALQRGMVTASITTYTSATETHFWEVLDYIDKTPIMCGGPWIIAVNKDALNALPEDLKKVFWDCASDYTNWVIAENIMANHPLEKTLVDGGMEVVLPEPGTLEQMRQMCIDAGLYHKFADECGPEGVELLKALGLY